MQLLVKYYTYEMQFSQIKDAQFKDVLDIGNDLKYLSYYRLN